MLQDTGIVYAPSEGSCDGSLGPNQKLALIYQDKHQRAYTIYSLLLKSYASLVHRSNQSSVHHEITIAIDSLFVND